MPGLRAHLVPDPNGHQVWSRATLVSSQSDERVPGSAVRGFTMRFVTWLLSALGLVARGFDATNGGGSGVRLDEAKRRAEADDAHRRRQDYRP